MNKHYLSVDSMPKSSSEKTAPDSSQKKTSSTAAADELERVIAHLDTAYEQGNECLHPTTKILVTDGEYDALRRKLKELRPKSKLFEAATASKLASTVAKVCLLYTSPSPRDRG